MPQLLHTKLLHIAHDLPTSAHLGIKKMYDRLARHFYWLGMRKSVVKYCRTCETCQHVATANMQHTDACKARIVLTVIRRLIKVVTHYVHSDKSFSGHNLSIVNRMPQVKHKPCSDVALLL